MCPSRRTQHATLSIAFIGAVFSGMLFQRVHAQAVHAAATSSPQPIPNFPTPRATVQGWIANLDEAAIRAHAWSLWAGINSTASGVQLPIWETWWKQQQVDNGPPKPGITGAPGNQLPGRGLEPPRQFGRTSRVFERSRAPRAVPGPGVSNVTSNQIAVSVNVDDPYAQFVWAPHKDSKGNTYTYWKSANLSGLNAFFNSNRTPTAQRVIDEFPAAAASIKPVFMLVKAAKTGMGPQGTTILPLWQGDLSTGPQNSTDPAHPTPDTWKNCVVVDPAGNMVGQTVTVTCNTTPNVSAQVIALSNFYSFVMDAATAAAFNNSVSNGNAVPGDYGVLVAMHLSTKEIKRWTWQTFFWTNGQHPGGPPPPSITTPWSNYETCTAYMETTNNQPGGTPTICYNPYLETTTAFPGGISSNCMSCHQTARFPINLAKPVSAFDSENPKIETDTGYPCSYNAIIQPGHNGDDNVYFDGSTRSDFSWLIGTIVPPTGTAVGCPAPASTGSPSPGKR